MTTRIDEWAEAAYYHAGNDYPWDLLPENTRDHWVEFITDVIYDRLGDGL